LNAYYFLCLNYNFRVRRDEIILIGFSRGAYTVRCLASFISCVGLIRRKALAFLPELFKGWQDTYSTQNHGNTSPQQSSSLQDLIISLKRNRLLFDTRIKVCGEWECVSSVWSPAFSLIQDKVPKRVDNAFHAVGLHEARADFQPVLWRQCEYREDGKKPNVKQCVFFGCHSDVGGGNADPGLATLSLLWMISQVSSVCDAKFDHSALLNFWGPNVTEVQKWGILGRYKVQQLDLKKMKCHVFAKGKYHISSNGSNKV
jgi:uncharacterized protein (DUF2235 family)